MPFGLVNAPTTFQRAMDLVLSGLSYVICLCYLDDVIVFDRDFNEHYNRLKTVVERLHVHGLRVKPEKCTIAARQVSFLGHVISDSGIMPDAVKIEAVNNISSPRNIKDIRSFLGLGWLLPQIHSWDFINRSTITKTDTKSGKLYLD